MATNEELERRIAKLEADLAELKRDRRTQIPPHVSPGGFVSYPQPAVLPRQHRDWMEDTPLHPNAQALGIIDKKLGS